MSRTYTLRKNNKIAKNKVIRFINSLDLRSRVTADTLRESNLLNVETRVMQLRLKHVHRVFNDLCPTYLKENSVPLKMCINILQGPAVITS